MRYLLDHLPEVEKNLHASPGCLLMLDFDGTLSSLAETPQKAFLPKDNRAILKKISRGVPTAIISGRGLLDIKRKVGIEGLIYVGNHGLEWEIENQRGQVQVPKKMMRALDLARRQLSILKADYPDVLLENKGLTLALHYRLVRPHFARRLVREARQIVAPFQEKKLLAIRESNKTLEMRPAIRWNKGKSAEFLWRKFEEDLLPIYIGDDITDEDAFKVLKDGITVKIGRGRSSAARYYLDNERQVSSFLKWLYAVLGGAYDHL